MMDYMLASLITPMFEKGVVGRHEDGMKWSKEQGSEVGADIAALLKQAASQNRGDLAGLVGQYNHAMEGVEDFSSNAAEYKKKR